MSLTHNVQCAVTPATSGEVARGREEAETTNTTQRTQTATQEQEEKEDDVM